MKNKSVFVRCTLFLVLAFALVAAVSCIQDKAQQKAPEMTEVQGKVLSQVIKDLDSGLAKGPDKGASLQINTGLSSSGSANLNMDGVSYSVEDLQEMTSVSLTKKNGDEKPVLSLGRTELSATVKGPSLGNPSVRKTTPLKLELADGFDSSGEEPLTLALFVNGVRYNLSKDTITNESGMKVTPDDLIKAIGIDISPIIEKTGENGSAVLLGAIKAQAKISVKDARFRLSSTFHGKPTIIEIGTSGKLSAKTSITDDGIAVSVDGGFDVRFNVEVGTNSIDFTVNLKENKDIHDIMVWVDGFKHLFNPEESTDASAVIEKLKEHIGLSLTIKSASVNKEQVDPDSFYKTLMGTIQTLINSIDD
ncbi:MAG: hypothetical protein ACFN3H_03280 [Spirochaetales bacterium]